MAPEKLKRKSNERKSIEATIYTYVRVSMTFQAFLRRYRHMFRAGQFRAWRWLVRFLPFSKR